VKSRITRRDFLKVSGAGLAGAAMLGAAGCGGGGSGQQGGGQQGGGGGGPITLRWWDYYSDLAETNEAIKAAIRRYMDQNPDVKIERTTIGFADLKPRIIQAAATGEMPDIVIIDNPDHQSFAEQGALADITDYFSQWDGASQYFEGPLQSTMYEGRNYGVPFESNATALYYNADALEEAGIDPPETWDDLRSAARKLTTGERSGFLFSAVGNEEGTFTFLPFLWQAGGDVQTFGGEAGVRALTFWNDLVNNDRSASREVINYGQADVYNQFIAGRAAMMINGPWQLPQLEIDKPEFRWDVAPWPRDREEASILGGENFAIGATDNVEAAWNVVRWMAEPENVKDMLITIGLPNREDMADDEAFTDDPQQAVFVEQVEIARPRAYGPNYPQISEQIWTAFQSVLSSGTPPEEAAQRAAQEIEPLLES